MSGCQPEKPRDVTRLGEHIRIWLDVPFAEEDITGCPSIDVSVLG
jgi:hypothetical protein